MLMPSSINMSKPNMAYAAGVAIILIVSLLISNVPDLALSTNFEFIYRKQACIGAFVTGLFFAVLTFARYVARVKEPWRVPQSQVSILYTVFFFSTLLALILAK